MVVSRRPVKEPNAGEHDHWFFIVGCQRSGTTLLRLILECHSRIQCCDEAVSYAVIAGVRPAPIPTRALLGLKIPCLTEQLARSSLWDAFVLPEVPNVYRGQRIVFAVRDVRDTVASMLALQVHGKPWVDTHLVPCLRSKIRRDVVFRRRYAADVALLQRARHPRLARAAFYWRFKTEALLDYLERGFPVLPVRYEDLTTQTERQLRRVCDFLGVSWEPGLLRHSAFAHDDVTADGLAVGGTDARRPIDSRSVARWHGTFTSDELEEMLHVAGAVQARFYPETAS